MDRRPNSRARTQRPPASPLDVPATGYRAVLRRSVRQFKRDDVSDRAAALTYYGVLAIFPGLLVLVSALALAGSSTVNKFVDNLRPVTPGGVSSFLRTVLQQVEGRSGSASIAAIIGVIVALWSASGYVAAFMRASNAIYGVAEGRPVTRTIPIRVGVTVALVIMLVASALIVVVTGPVASQVGHAMGIGNAAVTAWNIAKWPVLVVMVTIMISLLYWAAPNVKQPGFRWITPGGVLSVAIWIVASGLFAVYVAFSGSYNKTYGSFAAIIIFLVWLWISNLAILLGAEFNAEVERQRLVQAGVPEYVEPVVELRSTKKLDPDEQRRVAEAGRLREHALHRRR